MRNDETIASASRVMVEPMTRMSCNTASSPKTNSAAAMAAARSLNCSPKTLSCGPGSGKPAALEICNSFASGMPERSTACDSVSERPPRIVTTDASPGS